MRGFTAPDSRRAKEDCVRAREGMDTPTQLDRERVRHRGLRLQRQQQSLQPGDVG